MRAKSTITAAARWLAAGAIAATAAGCATTYELTLMPRNSGKLYQGEASGPMGGDMKVTVTIDDRVYLPSHHVAGR